jgi:protein TonB
MDSFSAGHDPTGRAFAGSLVTHGAVVGLLVVSGLWNVTRNDFGSPKASSGSVGVNMVKSIPIPRDDAPTNALANDTKSVVPEEPLPLQPRKQVKLEIENAVPIPERIDKNRKQKPQPQPKVVFKPPEAYKPNQVYAETGQKASSPLFGTQGSNGIDIGPASILGNRFGAYAALMRDLISQHWNTADVHASPNQKCAVTFVIARNGSISNVQVSQPSGNYLLDTSSKRAILDANPLPPLPAQFERNDATVELWFQLRQ